MTVNNSAAAAAAARAAAAAAARAAAAAAAKKAAEAAAKKAAAAKAKAEAAKKAAAEAKAKQAEAKKEAAAAKKELAAEKKALAEKEKALKPEAKEAKKPEEPKKPEEAKKPEEPKKLEEDKKALKEVEAQKAKVEAAEKKLKAAEEKLQVSEEDTAVKAKEAETRMREANQVAATEGAKPAFTDQEIKANELTANEVKAAFDGASSRRREDLAKTLGVDGTQDTKAIERELGADRDFAKLASKPENKSTLSQLGIKDGKDLIKLADRVDAQANRAGGTQRKGDLDFSKVQDKEALSNIIQGAGNTLEGNSKALLTDKKFADAVAGGKPPQEAAKERTDLNEQEKAATKGDAREGLDKLGMSQQQFQELKPEEQEKYLNAAQATADGKPADVLRAFGDTAPKAVAEKVYEDPKVKEGLDKLGLDKETFLNSGKGMADLTAATQAKDPKAAIADLTKASEANNELRNVASEAISRKAKELPEGAERAILEDRTLVRDMLEKPETQQTLNKLAEGDLSAIAGVQSEKVRNGLLDKAATDPNIKATLDKAKLKPADLKGLGAGQADVLKALETSQESTLGEKINPFDSGPKTDPVKSLELLQKAAAADPKAAAVANKLADSTIDSAKNDSRFKEGLNKLGLDAKTLQEKDIAAADLLKASEAATKGDTASTLTALRAANAGAPNVSVDAITKYAGGLKTDGTEGKIKTLLGDKKTVESLLADKGNPAAFDSIAKGDVGKALDQLGPNQQLRNQVIDQAATNAEFKKGLEEAGLTAEKLKNYSGPAMEQLYNGVDGAGRGDFQGSLRNFRDAVQKDPQLADLATDAVTSYAKKSITGTDGASKALQSMLGDKDTVKQLMTNPKLNGAFDALSSKDLLEGLKDAKGNQEAANAAVDALYQNADVKKAFGDLGLSSEALKQNPEGLDNFVGAAVSMMDGDKMKAAGYLRDAMVDNKVAFKPVLEESFKKLTESLSDKGPEGVLKSMLSGPNTEKLLAAEGKGFESLANGDVAKGVTELLANDEIKEDVAKQLMENTATSAFLGKLGIDSPETLLRYRDTVGSLISAGSKIADGKIAEGLKDLGEGITTLPPALKTKLTDALAQALPLPAKYEGLFSAAAGVLSEPGFLEHLGKGLEELTKNNNPAAFIRELSTGLSSAVESNPEAATNFLNELSTALPKDNPVAKFFSDQDLNAALVETGALSGVFNGVAKLAEGDITGALSEIGGAFGDLISAGDGFLGQDVVGKDGLQSVGRLFKQIYGVLPEGVQDKIEKKAAEIGGKGLLGSIPIFGDAINIASDIGPFIDALNGDDNIDKILTGSQLALDVVGLVPGADVFTTPLKQGVAVVQTVRELSESAETVNQFKDAFAP
jgi:hypothetical protein